MADGYFEKDYLTHPMLDLSHPTLENSLNVTDFKNRVTDIFSKTANILGKSYGPYGAPTIISDYPFAHVTKDGFNIMKKISFSKEYTVVDDAIKNLITAPCERLNYSVGDGTTTAIISVNAIYQNYMNVYGMIAQMHLAPRDILKKYNVIRDRIIEKLNDEIIPVDTSNHEEMVEMMHDVAYISSNADEEISNMIKELYDELDYPLIEIVKAPDGITKKKVTKGYHYNAILKDGLYVNNDNFTGEYSNCDAVIFDHKITQAAFDNILFPLNEECRKLKRHLICIAPSYDDITMMNVSRILTGEFKAMGDVNLILMVGKMASGINKNLTDDLALILNTNIITMGLESDIIKKIKEGSKIEELIDINNRNIPNITVSVKDKEGKASWAIDNGKIDESEKVTRLVTLDNSAIRAGFVGKCVLGMKDGSTFDDLFYDTKMYDKLLESLSHELKDLKQKSEAVSTYNFAAKDVESRIFKLRMKIGTIEVGGESGLSQDLLRDAVDDTVKATASAYHNGVVYGCSVATLRAIRAVLTEIVNNGEDPVNMLLARIICDGFETVYSTLLQSRFENFSMENIFSGIFNTIQTEEGMKENPKWDEYPSDMQIGDEARMQMYAGKLYEIMVSHLGYTESFETYWYLFKEAYQRDDGIFVITKETIESMYKHIIKLSVSNNIPYDLVNGSFNTAIVNSAKTDKEVLLASSDLMSLLIAGNQFIIADHQ